MTNEHTPGPWAVWMGSVAVLIQNQANPTYPENIASVFSRDPNGNDPRPYKANAALIAAAPELLAACEEAERILGNMGYTGDEGEPDACYQQLGRAIAKARPS